MRDFLSASIELQITLEPMKCLYVGQREYASVCFDDKSIDFIGSSDATTCHICLIVDKCKSVCSKTCFNYSKFLTLKNNLSWNKIKLQVIARYAILMGLKLARVWIQWLNHWKQFDLQNTKKILSSISLVDFVIQENYHKN